jgi:hypothetical protein
MAERSSRFFFFCTYEIHDDMRHKYKISMCLAFVNIKNWSHKTTDNCELCAVKNERVSSMYLSLPRAFNVLKLYTIFY